ncbi:DUF485 domain-containing protein [Streptomyces sp. NPDC096152]|uniref:DUF485 domain-containing protein n=1 Tax=Streptomyces sp. NPDC096152 TaxID=3366078 RepID=UPI0038023C76
MPVTASVRPESGADQYRRVACAHPPLPFGPTWAPSRARRNGMQDAFPSPEYRPQRAAPPYDSAFRPPPARPAHPPQPRPRSGGENRPALGHPRELRLLRGAYRLQRRVPVLTALGYFTLFLVLSAFVPSLTTRSVSGGLTTGLLLGLLQVPVTCLAVGLYEYTARRRVDPLAGRIREQAEPGAGRGGAR